MADSEPPDEVDDGKPPADRDVDSPDPDPLIEQPRHRQHEQIEEAERGGEDNEPGERMALLIEDDVADARIDRRVRMVALDHHAGSARLDMPVSSCDGHL